MTRARRFTIGIDEVGRGPLAGPVAVGAVAATPEALRRFKGIKESKQLSEKAREEWAARIRAEAGSDLRLAVSFVSARTIDRIGISAAIRRALAASIRKLAVDPRASRVLLDGGLKAPPKYRDQTTIVHGDAKEVSIAMASVVAKVARDRLMVRRDRAYPGYGFAVHKGYGIAAHIRALRRHGLSDDHRRSFCGFLDK